MYQKLILTTAILFTSLFASGEVNIYTSRHYEGDKKIYKTFTKKTGIKVNYVSGKSDGIIKRLESEGKSTSADILMVVDAARIARADKKDLLQSVKSKILEKNIPINLRDKNSKWFALAKRARVIVYSKRKSK